MVAQLTALAGLRKTVVSGLETRAQKLADRLKALEERGNTVMSKHEQALDDTEAEIKEAEDAVNQLSNGGPPLADGSFSQSSPPYPGPDLHDPRLVVKP